MATTLALIRLLLYELFVHRLIYISILIASIFIWYLSIATNIIHSNGIIKQIIITGLESSQQDWIDILSFGILIQLFMGVSTIVWITPNTTQKGRIELLHSKPLSRIGIFPSMFVTSLIGFSIGLIYLLSSIAIIWGLRFQFIFNGILLAILTSLFIALIILCYYFLYLFLLK